VKVSLGSLLERPPRYGIGAAAVPSSPGLPTYIRITDISDDGRFSPSPAVAVDSPRSVDYLLSDGDLVIARTGASVGKSYRYRPEDGVLVFAGFLICLSPSADRLDPKYFGYFLQSKRYWDWIAAESIRSGQPGINARQISALTVDVPDISNQREIAAQLEDAERHVEALEELIAKRTAVRLGVAQQLLTGHIRLPGFRDDWTDQSVGELGTFLKGRGIKRDDVRARGVPCIRYGEIYTGFADYTNVTLSFVSSFIAETALRLRTGDLLFAGSGETKEDIGKCIAYVGEVDAVAGGDIVVLRGNGYDPVFLATLLNTAPIAAQKARAGQGDAVVHISSKAIAALQLRLPSLPEQQAIASMIIDLDNEIAVLRRRKTAADAIKSGLIQALLRVPSRRQKAESV
jgi:type I restriction enzyme S subunit